MASTKGASAYPPPKTPIDKLSISCRGFDAKPVVFDKTAFDGNACTVTFSTGLSASVARDPVAVFMPTGSKNRIEVTSVKGKVIEGTFSFEMVDKKTKATLSVLEGKFKAQDRQY